MADKASSSKNASDNAQMESFQSILKSLNIPDPSAGDNAKITPEMMQKLSERIMGLLGGNAPSENASSGVTEDGLPVVEINEPEEVLEEELPPLNAQGQIIEDDIIRHDQLPPQEKARRIAAVNRFLDELEEEEEGDKERERAEARVWAEQKKRESAARAAGGLSAPRAPPRPPSDRAEPSSGATSATTSTNASKKPSKKNVRFKGDDSDSDEEQASGDLVFARLQKPAPPTPGSGLRGNLARMAASQPMKLDVVERAPGKPKVDAGRPSESRRPMPDSDDETPPQTPTQASSDEESGRLDDDELQELRQDYERRRAQVSIDPAEIDLSLAGRGGIGSGGWDEENVPLEATLASSRPKPAVSRFKSSRMKEGGSVSVPEIIPAGSSSTAFTNAIRLGRLQNEDLVAAADSDSDEDFERKHAATLEALKNYGSVVTPSTLAAAAPPEPRGTAPPARAAVGGVRERVPPRQGAAKPPLAEPAADSASTPDIQAKPKKVSRFKAEKGGQ